MEHTHLAKKQRSDRARETRGTGRGFGKEEGMCPFQQRQQTPGSCGGCHMESEVARRLNKQRQRARLSPRAPVWDSVERFGIMTRGWKNERGRREGNVSIREVNILAVVKHGRNNEYGVNRAQYLGRNFVWKLS